MSDEILDRVLTLELVRVTERAAVAASYLVGRGNEKDADQAAVDAMRKELNQLDIDGEVVIHPFTVNTQVVVDDGRISVVVQGCFVTATNAAVIT